LLKHAARLLSWSSQSLRTIGETMKINIFFSRICHVSLPRRALMMFLLITLAWNSLAFCGEIHDAARDGDLGKVKALLKTGPDLVSGKDDFSRTPLHYAAQYGHRAVAELLLSNKAEVNAKDNYGQTPLHYAAQYGRKDVAELLLSNKADVNAITKSRVTPLHMAAQQGYLEMAELLLVNKAEVNAKTNFGWTPLYVAAHNGHKDVAALLSQHGGRE
jgi:ankyrin repeat protein